MTKSQRIAYIKLARDIMSQRIEPWMSNVNIFSLVPAMWDDLCKAGLSPERVGITYDSFIQLASKKMHGR